MWSEENEECENVQCATRGGRSVGRRKCAVWKMNCIKLRSLENEECGK